MNEKALQVLEQYDLEVLRTFGGRGSQMLETAQGLKIIREFAGSRRRLPLEQQLLSRLEERGICRTDRAVPNREGELVSVGDYEIPYIVKNWPAGRECDPKSEADLLRSMTTLARIHREARGLEAEPDILRPGGERLAEFQKRNRELKRARAFIRGKNKKGEFELLFLTCAEELIREGEEACALLAGSACGELYRQACAGRHICHGEYMHHNILLSRQEVGVVNFRHFEINVQADDICLFVRKIMEKQNWNGQVCARLLAAYERERPLCGEERFYLGVSLLYPEKAWKLVHHYYHANKAWVPEKSAEKLEIFLAQSQRRRELARGLLG